MNTETTTPTKKPRRSRSILQAQTSLKDLLSAHESYRSTSKDIAEAVRKLRERYNLPNSFWQWVEGYADCRRDYWHRHCLLFCYVLQDEIVASHWDEMTAAQQEACRKGDNRISGFWWAKDGKPIPGRPFFVTKDQDLPKDPVTGHYPLSLEVTESYVSK